MRYYSLSAFEKKAREKARKEASKKRKHEKELEKRRLAREKKAAKEKAKKEAERQKELEKNRRAREKERQKRQKEEQHKEEVLKRRELRTIETEKRKFAKMEEKKRLHQIELEEAAKKRRKERRHKKALENKAKRKKASDKRRQSRLAREERNRRNASRYYHEVVRPEKLRKRLEANDVYGRFLIAVAQDLVIKKKLRSKSWWNDAQEVYDKFVEENHTSVLCPVEEISTANKPTRKTQREIVLMKLVNPEVEDNIAVFRDEDGKAVTCKVNDDKWTLVKKEPWYVEEKFIIAGLNPTTDKKTAHWICENIVEKEVGTDVLKKVILWRNVLIVDWGEDFSIVIGKTNNTATNLYMCLFKKYENAGGIIFFGYLHSQFVLEWIEKIKEKTGWNNVIRGKRTYLLKSSREDEEMVNSIPTTSKSTAPTDGNVSSGIE
ncbi:MAG: hypothetical protein J6X18_16710 [Bacteroidales bacterium]|nr:hypothetical protein [Bacteroidales bacterium]